MKSILNKILELPEKDQLYIYRELEKSLWEFRNERARTVPCGWCKRFSIADKEEDECKCS